MGQLRDHKVDATETAGHTIHLNCMTRVLKKPGKELCLGWRCHSGDDARGTRDCFARADGDRHIGVAHPRPETESTVQGHCFGSGVTDMPNEIGASKGMEVRAAHIEDRGEA